MLFSWTTSLTLCTAIACWCKPKWFLIEAFLIYPFFVPWAVFRLAISYAPLSFVYNSFVQICHKPCQKDVKSELLHATIWFLYILNCVKFVINIMWCTEIEHVNKLMMIFILFRNSLLQPKTSLPLVDVIHVIARTFFLMCSSVLV